MPEKEKLSTLLIKPFKQIKWWELLSLSIFFIALIVCGVVFKSGALVICNALVAIVAIFFNTKGIFYGNFLGIVNLVLYCVISYFNQFYGEIICAAVITFPCYCVCIFTWLKNLNKDTSLVKVTKKISLMEWILLFIVAAGLSVGIYYLLQTLNTANLIVSTSCTVFGGVAAYLMLRRCEFNFVFYLLTNVVSIALWCSTLSSDNLSQITTVVLYSIFVLLNGFGLINWIRMKKVQGKKEKISIKNSESSVN